MTSRFLIEEISYAENTAICRWIGCVDSALGASPILYAALCPLQILQLPENMAAIPLRVSAIADSLQWKPDVVFDTAVQFKIATVAGAEESIAEEYFHVVCDAYSLIMITSVINRFIYFHNLLNNHLSFIAMSFFSLLFPNVRCADVT